MKKTILYIAMSAAIAAVSVIAIIGCNDGGANAGRVSEEVNAFLNRFDNAVPTGTVTPPPDTSSGSITYKLITNVSAPEGGTVSRNPDKEAYAFGEAVTVTATPAGGYTFIEWSGESKSTNTTVVVTMDGDKALTAGFSKGEKQFTVTFSSVHGNAPPAATADSGSSITLPSMPNSYYYRDDEYVYTNNTYIFIEWSTNRYGGTGTVYSAGFSYTVTGDVTLYAQWRTESTPEACVVLYDGNGNTGGSGWAPPLCLRNCGYPSKPLKGQGDLVKTGYDFGGWSNDPSGEGTIYQPGDSACGMLYAVWKIKTCTLTVSASPSNGGILSVSPGGKGVYKDVYAYGEKVTVTARPTGVYTFTSWSGASSSKDSSVTIIMDDNKTLTAGFGKPDAKKFTVTFNSNGGGNNPQAATADSGSNITLPDQQTMQKNGYIFGGWNTNAAGTGTGYAANDSYPVTRDVTLFAKWTIVSYTVTFNAVGGIVSPASGTTGDGWMLSSLPTPTKEGHTFDGWFTMPMGGTVVTVGTVFSGNDVVFAKWTIVAYTVTFDANGGSVSPTSGITGDVWKLASLPVPARTGYTFGGWYTATTGGSAVTESYMFSANTTIYARWTGGTYNITYALNNATTTPSNPTGYTVETPSFTLNNPTRTGYTFAGWTGSNGTTAQTSVTVAKGTTGDLDYIANWTLNTYTVTFNANSGSVTPASGVTGEGWKLSSLPTPTRNGYTFGGWYTAATGGSAVTESSTFSAHTTIYARWTLIDYKITYTPNGATTTPSNPASYTIETASFILNNPSRTCYTFTGWTGSNGTTQQTGVTIPQGSTGDKSYAANWTAVSYTLTTNVSPAGGGTVSRNPNQTAPYSCGTSVTVMATPASGYVFTGWSGVATSTSASVSVTMNSDLTLTANFEKILVPFTDSRNNITYNTVKIGNQRWMKENLNYTTGNSWCYGNSNANCDKYGRLYDWKTAMAGSTSSNMNPSGVRGVCPVGWHLPSRQEWTELATFAGGSSTAGKYLKSTTGWTAYSGIVNEDTYGFSALPGGFRNTGGNFAYAGNDGNWWTATEIDAGRTYSRRMIYNVDRVDEDTDDYKEYGFSVRCVQD